MLSNSITINKRVIQSNKDPFIILEAGINHNGDIEIAKKMIEFAARSGADAIKFQTFKAEEFISDKKQLYTYFSQGKKVTESMYEMFKRFEFKKSDWVLIAELCKKAGIIFLSTPQNAKDLEFLLDIVELPAIKVGSDDLTNIPLLKFYAKKNLPMIISLGMAYLSEIDEAITAIEECGNDRIAILHCVSSYPAKSKDLNLLKIKTLSQAYNIPIGFSDHSIGIHAAIAAVALGACILEKHFTLDKNQTGPDHWFSADQQETMQWIMSIRESHKSLGTARIEPTLEEIKMRRTARRSIVAAKDIEAGQKLTKGNLTFKRPGIGIAPKNIKYLIGRCATKNIKRNSIIDIKDI